MASLEIGIVGLPNVGKTSVFNALTNAGAEVTAYAATQSSANIGVAPVPDARLDDLAEVAESRETIYATIQLSDVSGLVRGGAKGGSLGGEFLGHLRATDAILHVVRTFPDEDVFHVDGRVDPVADAEAVDLELILADHGIVERRIERVAKAARTGDKAAGAEADVLGRLIEHLDAGRPARDVRRGDAGRRRSADGEAAAVRGEHLRSGRRRRGRGAAGVRRRRRRWCRWPPRSRPTWRRSTTPRSAPPSSPRSARRRPVCRAWRGPRSGCST